MMNIAVIDDLVSERKMLRRLLEQYENEHQLQMQIEEFDGGREFLQSYIPGSYDAIFLDIFLNSENGVDCALELRRRDMNVNLIFLTTSAEFGVKSYDVRAADYIVKPATAEKLERALHYCIITGRNEPIVTVYIRRQPLKIELSRILYADFENRAAYLHLTDCLVPVSGSFTELSGQLTAYPQFMACFKGVVVNLQMVREVLGDHLILKNGERLPVSRRLQRRVKQQRLSLSAGLLRGDLI